MGVLNIVLSMVTISNINILLFPNDSNSTSGSSSSSSNDRSNSSNNNANNANNGNSDNNEIINDIYNEAIYEQVIYPVEEYGDENCLEHLVRVIQRAIEGGGEDEDEDENQNQNQDQDQDE